MGNDADRKKTKNFFHFYEYRLKEIFARLDIRMAIKITITALLSLYLCLQLDAYLKHPEYLVAGLWSVVASIIVLQANIGGTYKAIWNRFLGVLIGSGAGAFFAFEFGAQVEVIGLAIFVTIVACSFLKIPESYRMAALSVVIIMLPWKLHPASDPWIYAFFRFLDTCLGFAVAILVSHLLWPSEALTKMRLNLAETSILFQRFFEHLLIPNGSPRKSHAISQSLSEEINQALNQSRTVLEESKVELLVKFEPAGVWIDLLNCQERLWESFRVLEDMFHSPFDQVFDEKWKLLLHHIVDAVDSALRELSKKLKTGRSSFDFYILNELQEAVNQELVRFRAAGTLKGFPLDLVENYFVFFYQIKQVLASLECFDRLLVRLENAS